MDESIRKKYDPVFGSWHIVEEIGHGAVGRVYEIQREEYGVTYRSALKIISVPGDEDDMRSAMFSGVAKEDLPEYYRNLKDMVIREFQYLAQLKGNSYIVSYEDHQVIEHEDGIGWDILIKMELLEPLVEFSLEHELSERDVLHMGIDLCRALEFCQQYGIVHRDIKPENIFLAPSGDYKLGDFGIARVAEKTQVGLTRKGTYMYMAPEVFHGNPYGASSDLYSLGLVMYKYLNHDRYPFMPPYPEKIVYDDLEKSFVKRMGADYLPDPDMGSEAMKIILRRACARDVKSRYHSAEEMEADLLTVQVGDGDAIVKRETGRQVKTAGLTRRWKIALISLLIVALSAVGIYGLIPKAVSDIRGLDGDLQLYYDEPLQLSTVCEPDWFKDEPVEYESNDEKVFTVSADGLVKPVAPGKAMLTASAREYSESVQVIVVPKVTAITGVEKNYSLKVGDKKRLRPVLVPREFKDEPITYKSQKPKVAKVGPKGRITAVRAGTAWILISAGGKTTRVKVKVTKPKPEPTPEPAVTYYGGGSSYGGSSSGGSSSGGSSGGSKGGSKKSSGSSGKKPSGSGGGYFDSGDDEYF